MREIKVYVGVRVSFDTAGQLHPRAIRWEDGRLFHISAVRDRRAAHARRAGGCGDRYTVLVNGRETYLFFEPNTDREATELGRWFVERRA